MREKCPPRSRRPRSPRLSQVRTLRDLGLSLVARRAFFQGEVITFEIPTLGGYPTIATLQWTGTRLCAGLFSVHDTSGAGMRAFTDFRGRARQMARVMGVEELEIQGIAVTNPRIEQMLLRQGFTRQTVEIPEALGGDGRVEVFSKVFRMR
jgi:hypothetical protein